MKKVREYCTAENCCYRRQTAEGRAFCMMPKCPFDKNVYIDADGNTYSEAGLKPAVKDDTFADKL